MHMRNNSLSVKLVELKGKNLQKAPKFVENQIFRDVYDASGNHDRVLDLSNLSDKGPCIIFQWSADQPMRKPLKVQSLNQQVPLEKILKKKKF